MGDRPGRTDGTAGWHFEVARVDVLLLMRQLGPPECPGDFGASIHRVERQAKRETVEHLDPRGPRHRGQPRVRDVLGQPDIDVQPERRGDLILEELSQAAMLWINTAQQLALVEPEGDAVISLPRAR